MLDSIVDSGFARILARSSQQKPPDRLFHFTTVEGLVGILTSGCLWASLATALNDENEVVYCIGRARVLCEKGIDGVSSEFLMRIKAELESNDSVAELFRGDPYVVSLCGRSDQASQWLHYAKSGRGVAIGFDTPAVRSRPFDLIPVIYESAEQDTIIRGIISDYFVATTAFAKNTDNSDPLWSLSAELAAQSLRVIGTHIKDPGFKTDEEWRLITFDLKPGADDPDRLPTKFRSVAGRVVPYKEYLFKPGAAISEVVLGNKVPMMPVERALMILFETTAERQIPTSVSPIKVRE